MTSQWRHRNKTHSCYSELNYVQNLYFRFFIFWKLTELCRFVTYLWDDPCILQGSGVTRLRYDDEYGMDFVANLVENTTVKNIKMANICRTYERMYSGTVFDPLCKNKSVFIQMRKKVLNTIYNVMYINTAKTTSSFTSVTSTFIVQKRLWTTCLHQLTAKLFRTFTTCSPVCSVG